MNVSVECECEKAHCGSDSTVWSKPPIFQLLSALTHRPTCHLTKPTEGSEERENIIDRKRTFGTSVPLINQHEQDRSVGDDNSQAREETTARV